MPFALAGHVALVTGSTTGLGRATALRLAQAGAKVLNAQAVEFAKERGIALYARSTFGGPAETVVRRISARSRATPSSRLNGLVT